MPAWHSIAALSNMAESIVNLHLKGQLDFEEAVSLLKEIVRRAVHPKVNPFRRKLESVRNHLRYNLALRMETPAHVANAIAQWVSRGGTARSVQNYLHAVESVSPEAIAQTAKAFLIPNRRNVVALVSNAGAKQ